MFERHYFKIKSEKLQQKVQEFTKSTRFWTAYPADTLETVLKHYNILPAEYRYAHFNPDTEEAIFVGSPYIPERDLPEGVTILPDTGIQQPLIGDVNALRALPKSPDEK